MKSMKLLEPVLMCFVLMILLCNVLYTVAIASTAQLLFPNRASGSTITVTLKDETKKGCGSELIVQEFTRPEYLVGRPTGVTNLFPTNEERKKLVEERIDWRHFLGPDNTMDIPMDLVTTPTSGMDPSAPPAATEYQAARIAAARNVSVEEVGRIIQTYTSGPFLGVTNEPAVSVLKVNLALDSLLSS